MLTSATSCSGECTTRLNLCSMQKNVVEVRLDSPIKAIKMLRVVSAEVPLTYDVFREGVLHVVEQGAQDVGVGIPDGTYPDLPGLAAAVQAALASSALAGAYSAQAQGSSISIVRQDGLVTACYYVSRYSSDVMGVVPLAQAGNTVTCRPDLAGAQYLTLRSPTLGALLKPGQVISTRMTRATDDTVYVVDNEQTDAVCKLPRNAPMGEVAIHDRWGIGATLATHVETLRGFRMYLSLGDDASVLDLRGRSWSVSLEVVHAEK